MKKILFLFIILLSTCFCKAQKNQMPFHTLEELKYEAISSYYDKNNNSIYVIGNNKIMVPQYIEDEWECGFNLVQGGNVTLAVGISSLLVGCVSYLYGMSVISNTDASNLETNTRILKNSNIVGGIFTSIGGISFTTSIPLYCIGVSRKKSANLALRAYYFDRLPQKTEIRPKQEKKSRIDIQVLTPTEISQ
jgi:hypothetical protein